MFEAQTALHGAYIALQKAEEEAIELQEPSAVPTNLLHATFPPRVKTATIIRILRSAAYQRLKPDNRVSIYLLIYLSIPNRQPKSGLTSLNRCATALY